MTAEIIRLPSTPAEAWEAYVAIEREAAHNPLLRLDPVHRRKLDGAWQRYQRARENRNG